MLREAKLVSKLEHEELNSELPSIPKSWGYCSIAEVTLPAKTIDPKQRLDLKFKYVDVSAVSKEWLEIKGYTEYFGANAPSRARKEILTGDVLFATIRPSLKRIAIVPPSLNGQICSTAFCVIRPNPKLVDSEFLFYEVSSEDFVHRVSSHERGVSYPAVTDRVVVTEKIGLPPLSEQREIAKELSSIRRAIVAERKVLEIAQEFKRSAIENIMVNGIPRLSSATYNTQKTTDIGPIPERWKLTRLGEHATVVTKGSSPRWQGFDYVTKGIIFLRAQNVINGEVDLTDTMYLSSKFNKTHPTSILMEGDLLVTIAGTIGRVAVVPKQLAGANTNQAIAIVRLRRSLNPMFAAAFLTTRVAQEQFISVAKQLAQANLSLQDVKNTLVPLPTIEEQQEIASLLQTTQQKIDIELLRLRTLESLYRNLLRELLSGKLRLVPKED